MAEDKGRGKSDTALREEEVLKFWKDNAVFDESLKKNAPKGEFVFYDGPPFATGLPHSGSLLSSVSKDLIPRYKTMRGYKVRRRWGWDTHGLPIENLVEKKLGLKNKKEILALGIEKFNAEARSLVLEYVSEWKRYVERVGRWVDFDDSYKTMDATYTESVWWALKEIHKKGNLYEGRKVLMYCPHCETVLAKAEIAMDNTYRDITEEAVFVKFRLLNPESIGIRTPAFMVAWTTTPWTLPGNVALAVGPDIDYALIQSGDETLIIAKERAESLGYSLLGADVVKGKVLYGLKYEPLYEVAKVQKHAGKKWQVLTADFVTTTDGTGVVHTAVMYGEDDYALGLKEGLPMVPLLNQNATYNDDAPEFVRGEYIKKAEAKIKDDLESRGLLLKRESHTHSYPHCYRCGTPLIYNAVSSWFINIQSVKDKMLAENEKISWFPEHLKHGRFQKIVETAPDWTISRNRFWASPLPMWKDDVGNVTVVGSLQELKSLTKKSGNTYSVMRHGESDINTASVWKREIEEGAELSARGREQIKATAEQFKSAMPDVVISSTMIRARQSAQIFSEVSGYPASEIVYDERLREWNVDDTFEGEPLKHVDGLYESKYMRDAHAPISENFAMLVQRVGDFLYDIEKRYSNKKVLIIAHDGTNRALQFVAAGLEFGKLDCSGPLRCIDNGEVVTLSFVSLPHNKDYELDYHLPYIDRVELEKDGKTLKRIPEVVDCWVESGAMPFAEYHYPFENKELFEKRTPGDFVSEYIGQTRAWFYYMHAMSVHLFGHLPFRNVTTTGNINAADGQKLSKSKKNYTDPYELFDKYGADAFRYYLMSSVVMQAEDIEFRDDDVKEIHGRVVNILRNTKSFYALHKDEAPVASDASSNVLDRWILTRLEEVLRAAGDGFDRFDTVRATRPMRDFVDDFSTWYVRRSRDRMKGDELDKGRALGTMRYILREFAKVIAPVMPFVAEEIYQEVRAYDESISVHLTEWPKAKGTFIWRLIGSMRSADSIVADMQEVRAVVTVALEARQKAGIKVRQPLALLKVNSAVLVGKDDLLDLVRDELNVKKVLIDQAIQGRVWLDTELSQALIDEGEFRDLAREVQDLRKTAGLNPKDQAILLVPEDKRVLVQKHWEALKKAANLKESKTGDFNVTKA